MCWHQVGLTTSKNTAVFTVFINGHCMKIQLYELQNLQLYELQNLVQSCTCQSQDGYQCTWILKFIKKKTITKNL